LGSTKKITNNNKKTKVTQKNRRDSRKKRKKQRNNETKQIQNRFMVRPSEVTRSELVASKARVEARKQSPGCAKLSGKRGGVKIQTSFHGDTA